jgi:hypothetical protein
LWSADYETGDVKQWDRVAISGDGTSTVVTSPVHSGRYANALTIDTSNTKTGVRMVYKSEDDPWDGDSRNLPDEAYYSVWYYIPERVTIPWLNALQWKQQRKGSNGSLEGVPLYSASMYNDSDGQLVFKLHTRVDENGQWMEGHNRWLGDPSDPVPIGRWFHLESYYKWDKSGNGRIATWVDGHKIWDVSGITTEFDWSYETLRRQWTVNNYSDDTSPSKFTIYVDDVVVSTSRVGP